MAVTLRPTRPDEWEWLYRLHEAAMRERVERDIGPWLDANQRAHFADRDPRNVIHVIELDGEPVGAVHARDEEDGSRYIDLIEVLPVHQGRGIGGAAVEAVVAAAAHTDVTLRVRKANPARALYERLGFVTEGENETHFLMRRVGSGP